MAPVEIVQYPNPVLSLPTRVVEEFSRELKNLAATLIQVMIDAPGVGVAANQIGADLSVAVIGIPSTEQPLILVNPVVLKASTPVQVEQEGCLSLPGYWGRPLRSERVRVRYQDLTGKSMTLDAAGYLAQVIQHETDHLNGFVFEQRLPEGEALQAIDTESSSTGSD